MFRISLRFILMSFFFYTFTSSAKADDNVPEVVLPAGSLIRCTLDEPSFSTKTADIGDPVICHLSQNLLFDQPVFPRGAYLSGHLEAAKEPGHFVGKGYLQLEFDKIGFPNGEIPFQAKVISAKGYRVDREGKIVGHGHPVRDAVEWMFPPLWPEKVVTLPARGPRPTLKGEEQLVLRVMADTAVPKIGWHYFTHPAGSSLNQPNGSFDQYILASAPKRSPRSGNPTPELTGSTASISLRTASSKTRSADSPGHTGKMKVLVLRDGSSCVGSDLRVGGGELSYTRADGTAGALPANEVDWVRTLQKNAQYGVPFTVLSAGR